MATITLRKIFSTYLNISIFPCENRDSWQTGDDATLQDQDGCPHEPVQGHDAWRFVIAELAALGARKTLEHTVDVVLTLLALQNHNVPRN